MGESSSLLGTTNVGKSASGNRVNGSATNRIADEDACAVREHCDNVEQAECVPQEQEPTLHGASQWKAKPPDDRGAYSHHNVTPARNLRELALQHSARREDEEPGARCDAHDMKSDEAPQTNRTHAHPQCG